MSLEEILEAICDLDHRDLLRVIASAQKAIERKRRKVKITAAGPVGPRANGTRTSKARLML